MSRTGLTDLSGPVSFRAIQGCRAGWGDHERLEAADGGQRGGRGGDGERGDADQRRGPQDPLGRQRRARRSGGLQLLAHASTTIQHAVDASHRGDTVKVCPGTYLEQVTIKGHRDGLMLESSRKWGATIKAPTSLEAAGPYGFTVLVLIDRVDYVTVRGFKVVTRTQAPCDIVGAGIAAIASKQTAIRGNRLFAPGTSTEPGSCYQLNGIVAIDCSA